MAKLSMFFTLALIITKVRCSSDEELRKVFKQFTDWRFQENPEYATSAGDYRHNDRLRNFDVDSMDKSKIMAGQLLEKVKAIDPDEVSSESDRVSLALLEDMLETYLEGYEWRFFTGLNSVHFMGRETRDPGRLAAISPFDTVGDFENFLSRLRVYPERMDTYIQKLTKAIRMNYTYNHVSISRVFKQIDAFIDLPANQTDLYKPFTARLEALATVRDKRFYRQRGEAAVETVQTVFLNLRNFLAKEYAPRTRMFYGVNGFRRGKEFYAACLRWYLSYNITPEAVHELGLQEVSRIEENMREIMARQGHNGTIKEYFDQLKTEARFFKNTGEELLEEYRTIMNDQIASKLPEFFESLPPTPVYVRSTPTDSTSASYSRGSVDGSVPSYFNVNVFRPREKPTFPMVALVLHETLPGHHMQRMQAMMSDLPTFRKQSESGHYHEVPFALPSYTAFTEGWALYAEFLGEEMGVYKDDYELMGRYSYEIFRACRLVVDTGLHYYGWERQRAIEYMLNYTTKSRTSLEIEVDRYLTIPGQACAYKIGEIKLREIRKQAQEKLGDKFDVKKFHSVVLNNGAVPLAFVQDSVNRWIETMEVPPMTAPPCVAGATTLHTSVPLILVLVLLSLCKIL